MNNSFIDRDFDMKAHAEKTLLIAMHDICEGIADIRCHCNVFDKAYPNVMYDLNKILGYIDNFKFTEE